MGKFKYQVLVDGTVAPYRTGMLMEMDSLVLKQESGEVKNMIPWYFFWKSYYNWPSHARSKAG